MREHPGPRRAITANDLCAWLVYALDMLDVRRLRVLREVAAHGSFSAAAEALAFTQPAVSRQIATLETEAGARLVERSARGVRLTQAGELLVGHADAILDRLDRRREPARGAHPLEGGRLHIGAPATANATLIPLAVRAFDEAYPEVHLRLDEAISSELIDALAAGELDIAIVANADRLPEMPGEIVLEHLMDDPLHLAVAHDHPLAEADEMRMADLADEAWIEGRDPVCAEPLRHRRQRRGLRAEDLLRVRPVARQAGARRGRRRRDADPDARARERARRHRAALARPRRAAPDDLARDARLRLRGAGGRADARGAAPRRRGALLLVRRAGRTKRGDSTIGRHGD